MTLGLGRMSVGPAMNNTVGEVPQAFLVKNITIIRLGGYITD